MLSRSTLLQAAFFLVLVSLDSSTASHFRGGIIMIRPQPEGTEYEMEIFYHISWRRSYPRPYAGQLVHFCDDNVIATGRILGDSNTNQLECQYGCPKAFIASMTYVCTSFSIETVEDWTFGEQHVTYDFSFAAGNVVTIGFSGRVWIEPISSNWNLSTTFSLATRNDTGRINSTPRAITVPVIRLQENCNHTINVAVSDPDGDIVRCRWAVGLECGGICNNIQFPGAILNSNTCTIEYQANMGSRYWAAAIMLEDFLPDSSIPLSSVGLQFLVLVHTSPSELCLKPTFVEPTIRHGSCVAIPPGTSFETQLISESTSPSISITEIQTAPPRGTREEALTHITGSSYYYVNVTWSPDNSQQNKTHLFCFAAVGSDRVASDQICFNLLPGFYPPRLIPATALPNQQLVYPSNTTWQVQFDMNIVRSSVVAYIAFHEYDSDKIVYRIDASQSVEVGFGNQYQLSITPNYAFEEKVKFYITLDREVVRGLEQCGPGNEPVLDKTLWTFETMDVTPPLIRFTQNSTLYNTNVTFSWESNENATYMCILMQGLVEHMINCSEAYWSGYGLNEGSYVLEITATDQVGNIAMVTYGFDIDLTPPLVLLLSKPNLVSGEHTFMFTFSCNESFCLYECAILTSNGLHRNFSECNDGHFVTPMLQANTNYTFLVQAIDEVGNRGETLSYSWQTDFEAPHIFGIDNTSTSCNVTGSNYTGQAHATDNRPEAVLLKYNDVQSGCSISRTWTAMDVAGNTAQLVQSINLVFTPSVSRLPEVALLCDSTSNMFLVSNTTVHVPNPCGLPLQLSYEDSDYICPGILLRNWTVSVCGSTETVSQTLLLYDVCPPFACGRNESEPRGICSFGECQCNRPWYGEDCNTILYEPLVEQINDTNLMESEEYMATVIVSRGTAPLSWSLISGPEGLFVDQYSGHVIWNRAQAGNYTIVIQVENQVGGTQVSWSLQVIPAYNASLLPISVAMFPYAQPLLLRGYIEFTVNNVLESDHAGVLPVNVYIVGNSATRMFTTNTTANGSFLLTFYPSPTEYGMFTAGARHPSSTELLPQIEFIILGMKSVPAAITLIGEAIREFEKTFYNATVIYNDGPGPLTGLIATPVLPNTRDISIEIFLRTIPNSTLEPGDFVEMDIRVIASRPLTGIFLVHIEAIEGTSLQLIASLQIDQALPHLSIDPPSLNTRIVPGQLRVFEFNVTNSGRAAANNVRSILPQTAFISFVSFGNGQQRESDLLLQSGESAAFSILVQTPSNQQLGEIDATIILASNEVYTSLSVALIVTSDTLMNLTVVVEDEYTYFASGQPLVSNAAVTLVNYHRDVRLTLSTEACNGTVKFTNIYEDRYELVVEAPSHRALHQIVVTSFESPVLTVFIERQTVTYTWSVTPITYQDIYSITLEADFETRVPIPVVTVTPYEINLDELESGAITSFQLNITNHGLIRADNVGIQFPNHPFLTFSSTSDVIGDLGPLSSVVVSIQSSRKTIKKRSTLNRLGNNFASTLNWALYLIDVVYSYVCNEPQIRKTPVVLKKSTICDNAQLSQPIEGVLRPVPLLSTTPVDGTAYYTPGIYDPNSSPSVALYPGRLGNRPTYDGSFSFHGYSSKKVDFCNPCFSAILECTPTPFDMLADRLFPKPPGCLPSIPSTTTLVKTVIHATGFLDCDQLNKIDGIVSTLMCATNNGAFSKCLNLVTGNRNKRNVGRSVNELVEAMYPIQQSIALAVEVLGDEVWILAGDSKWLSDILRPAMSDESEVGVLISSTELSAIVTAPPPNGTTIEMVSRMVERINNTLFGWTTGQLEPSDSSNMASFSIVQDLAENIATYNEKAIGKGFSSYLDAYNFASGEVNQIDNFEEEAGVCAVIKIQIQQELAITREAFLARLEIENLEDLSLEQIFIEIIITSVLSREQATHLFSIGNGTLSGSLTNNVNGGWMLPSSTTGAVEWIIVPYSEAAPDSDHIYNVGGSFRYIFNGENITVPLFPTPITVRPDPSLLVHYFWERYVVGDDPFTNEVEASIPFTLGVAVKNSGYGTAHNLQISTAQPEIIDNERGLLINYMIISTIVGGNNATPSLRVMFGDLAPNATIVARWFMISSLQGEFMKYSATFENMNPLGDPKLSILDDLQIHELIRNVVIYTPNEEDGLLDFLVNDRNDFLAYPDALYSSKTLMQYNVSVGIIHSVQANPKNNIMTTSLVVRTTTNTTGWVYYRYEDTQSILNNTASSVNITKHENNESFTLPFENSWITRDRNERSGADTFYLHILDHVETTDEVVYMLDPCLVDCLTLGVPYGQPAVRLPTPDVTIVHLPRLLYAGTTTPLTLNCSVGIDPSLMSYTNVSILWQRGTIPLSNNTSRISISSILSDTSSSFSSILTIYPLSTADNTSFTCIAQIIPSNESGILIASDQREDTVSVIVQDPPIPVLNIQSSNNSSIAGDTFKLTCSVMVVPDDLIADLVLMWSGPGVDTSSVQLTREASNVSLVFSPLRTSHGGVYYCTASLDIPEVDVHKNSMEMMTINVQIPSPSLTVSGTPVDNGFFQGLDLNLSCNIKLHTAVDSPVLVLNIWQGNGTEIQDKRDYRITVINTTLVKTPLNYQTTLRFNPVDIVDVGSYTCTVTVLSLNDTFITGTTTSITRNITEISSFPPQNVTVTENGNHIAGYSDYTLLCTVNRDKQLTSSTISLIQWLDPNGVVIVADNFTTTESEGSATENSGDRASISNNSGSASGMLKDTTDDQFTIIDGGELSDLISSRLIFNKLMTSQAGEYTCRALLSIPGTNILNHTEEQPFIVIVKLPAPEVLILRSREDPLYEGTIYSLICMVLLNTSGVDTEYVVDKRFPIPGRDTSNIDRITLLNTDIPNNAIQLSIMFAPLIINDTGSYVCSALLISNLTGITASDTVINVTEISVLRLPHPNVAVLSPVSTPTAGDNHTLTCLAMVEEHLIAKPVLKWSSVEGFINVSETDSVIWNHFSLVLRFNPLLTSDGGTYTCEATLNIPQAGISNISSVITKNVIVQIPTPVLSFLDHPIPYNGTLFTISGIIHLDPHVDTNITSVGLWSTNDSSPQVGTSPPYQTDLEFRPLTPDSSNRYTLNVTVSSSDDSPFIAGSSGSITYSLEVQPLPPQTPTIIVTSRHQDGCGEARTLSCIPNPVNNLFTSPTIEWLGPDGSEVPTGGSNNPSFIPQTGQLIFSDISIANSGKYVCHAIINISESQILDHFDDISVTVSTDFPDKVKNLMCNTTGSPSRLLLSWEAPAAKGEEVTGYDIMVKELQHGDSTRDVVTIDIADLHTKQEAIVLHEGLKSMVPYEITVTALNFAGCGDLYTLYCFTQEGVPPSPKNVLFSNLNSTAIYVSWDKQTLIELKGLANYIIEYSQFESVSNKKRQSGNIVTVPWTETNVIITNLTPDAMYSIFVSVSTSVGISDVVSGTRDVSASTPSVASESNTGIIIGGVLSVLFVIAIVVIIIVITVVVYLRRHRDNFKTKSNRAMLLEIPVSGTMLSSVHYNKAVYDNPCYDDVKPTVSDTEQQHSTL